MHLQNVFLLEIVLIVIFFSSFVHLIIYVTRRLIELYVWFVFAFFFLRSRVKKLLFFDFFFLFPCCTFCPLNQACYRYDKISLLFLYILLVIMVDRLPGYQMVQPIYRICRERIEFLTIFFFYPSHLNSVFEIKPHIVITYHCFARTCLNYISLEFYEISRGNSG